MVFSPNNRWALPMATIVSSNVLMEFFTRTPPSCPVSLETKWALERLETFDSNGSFRDFRCLDTEQPQLHPQKWRFGIWIFRRFSFSESRWFFRLQPFHFPGCIFLHHFPDILVFVDSKRYGTDNESDCWAPKILLLGKINQIDVDFLGYFISFLWSFQHKHVNLSFPSVLNGANRSQLPSPCGQRQMLQGLVNLDGHFGEGSLKGTLEQEGCILVLDALTPILEAHRFTWVFFEKRAVFVDMMFERQVVTCRIVEARVTGSGGQRRWRN